MAVDGGEDGWPRRRRSHSRALGQSAWQPWLPSRPSGKTSFPKARMTRARHSDRCDRSLTCALTCRGAQASQGLEAVRVTARRAGWLQMHELRVCPCARPCPLCPFLPLWSSRPHSNLPSNTLGTVCAVIVNETGRRVQASHIEQGTRRRNASAA